MTTTSRSAPAAVSAPATCHCVIREGFNSLEEADELEEDFLDRAWGLEATSRLSCQAKVGTEDITVEIRNIPSTMQPKRRIDSRKCHEPEMG